MKRFVQLSLAAATTLAVASVSMAATSTVYVPSGLSNAQGSAIGWDGDKAAPEGGAGAPVGFGDSSMKVDVAAGDYRTLRVFIGELFGAPVTLRELAGFSFDTFGDDAYAIIYTQGTSVGSSWYSGRYVAQASNLANADWQTNASGNGSLNLFDNTPILGNANPFAPVASWTDLQSLNANPIQFIDFKIGAANPAFGAQNGQLDALSFTTVQGVNQTIDLAVVPLPAAVSTGLTMLGALGLGGLIRSKRRAV